MLIQLCACKYNGTFDSIKQYIAYVRSIQYLASKIYN